ncbi:MAG: BREX system serine/threonine kinase PglW [Gemmataceae bacterium]
MSDQKKNWTTVTESRYPWERDALDFVRDRWPDHEPYRAWANFEFIALDGSINEVDLLLLTPMGFFLVEIKSRPGRVSGDAGTWTWEIEGRRFTATNPLLGANLKAKKLKNLLLRQKAVRPRDAFPFIEPLVFLSAPDMKLDLRDTAAFGVCLRDLESAPGRPERPGILAAVRNRNCPGLPPKPGPCIERPLGKVIAQAIVQAGIPSGSRNRRVSDYQLEQLLEEGPGYQDWEAAHVQGIGGKRRIRLYHVESGATADDREMIRRAARRDFQLTEALQHPGVLRALGYTEHEVGPAIVFEHDPHSLRLDHFLAQRGDRLRPDVRLDLLRQAAEVIRFAHEKKAVHRGLCPRSILICDPDGQRPRVKLFNWQVAYRLGGSSTAGVRDVTATSHVDDLTGDGGSAYMAPEAVLPLDGPGEHLDLFSLGAIAYHVFAGVAPAANRSELAERLRASHGLRVSDVLNGAALSLQHLIQSSTHPNVADRTNSAVEFLTSLDAVEEELTAPATDTLTDPIRAQKGDRLAGGFTVLKRLGEGSTSVAHLVERGGEDFILKVASNEDKARRVRDEGEVLAKLRHPYVAQFCSAVDFGATSGILISPAYAEKADRKIETLGQRLRKEGRLHVDLLQRFGEDLLEVVKYLEEQGIPHRDIKPDNIAVGMVGRGDPLHLVLFDFSLSRTPPENIEAGTKAYLDPCLFSRKRWDLFAERYAAAVTLFEMTTGTLPVWGDGRTEPSQLECEATVDAELFDPALRETLVPFFTKAFRRDTAERFDNSEVMLQEWRRCFEVSGLAEPATELDEEELRRRLVEATFDSSIHELALGTRATNALDRANVLTVEDLLAMPMRRLLRLRGVGNKTRREITAAVKILRERLGNPSAAGQQTEEAEEQPSGELAKLSVDLLAQRLTKVSPREGNTVKQTITALLGLEEALPCTWPGQAEVARFLGVTRARVGQVFVKVVDRWGRDKALSPLREDVAGLLSAAGGVMTAGELGEAILAARGSVLEGPQRSRLGQAAARAAVEVERTMAEPRYLVRRDDTRTLVALHPALADHAARLGDRADKLASEDPLATPARALQMLREVPAPVGFEPLADGRLLRLAAAASCGAALSSRQEVYPRGMEALRALKLAKGALGNVKFLSVEQIRDRVGGRYPEAESMPDRPRLDELLARAGVELVWDDTEQSYTTTARDSVSISSASMPPSRLSTGPGRDPREPISPDEADARQFEEKLRRSLKDGAFLTLLVPPRSYLQARRELEARFPLRAMDGDRLIIDALRDTAKRARVDWSLVLRTDATPSNGDWNRLMMLVKRAIPKVEEQLCVPDATVLLVHPGLLARYDNLDLLERLRDKVGRPGGPGGLWLLLPGHQPLIDGKAVPLLSPAQRVLVPESWVGNWHRTSRKDAEPQRKTS